MFNPGTSILVFSCLPSYSMQENRSSGPFCLCSFSSSFVNLSVVACFLDVSLSARKRSSKKTKQICARKKKQKRSANFKSAPLPSWKIYLGIPWAVFFSETNQNVSDALHKRFFFPVQTSMLQWMVDELMAQWNVANLQSENCKLAINHIQYSNVWIWILLIHQPDFQGCTTSLNRPIAPNPFQNGMRSPLLLIKSTLYPSQIETGAIPVNYNLSHYLRSSNVEDSWKIPDQNACFFEWEKSQKLCGHQTHRPMFIGVAPTYSSIT